MRPDGPRNDVAGPESGPEHPFPLRLNGKVIRGFGRGSSELGIPTANIPVSGLSVGGHEDVESGVYYGWAGLSPSKATKDSAPSPGSEYKHMKANLFDGLNQAIFELDRHHDHHHKGSADVNNNNANGASTQQDRGTVYPMVMSIGWNPYYKNTVRSVEVHIMHEFAQDFYDSHMNLLILGFIRPEYDYVSLDSLIEDIKTDIDVAGRSLARAEYVRYARDAYLFDFEGRDEVGS